MFNEKIYDEMLKESAQIFKKLDLQTKPEWKEFNKSKKRCNTCGSDGKIIGTGPRVLGVCQQCGSAMGVCALCQKTRQEDGSLLLLPYNIARCSHGQCPVCSRRIGYHDGEYWEHKSQKWLIEQGSGKTSEGLHDIRLVSRNYLEKLQKYGGGFNETIWNMLYPKS